MTCEMCKKAEATVRYTEVVEKKVVKMNLCEECAKKKGVSIQAPFTIADLLSGLADLGSRAREDAGKVCDGCGLSFLDFRKSGRLGCDRCYTTFLNGLHGVLEAIHKSVTHAGKVPSRARGEVDRLRLLGELDAEMCAAVKNEEFEKAAALRDRIQALKREARARSRKERARGAKA
ncbi:MAG: UvrB/UvrC motif-containing protein [bacterium]|nr:UvrB/UvrC motif-containing protein [bacterium]